MIARRGTYLRSPQTTGCWQNCWQARFVLFGTNWASGSGTPSPVQHCPLRLAATGRRLPDEGTPNSSHAVEWM